MRRESSDDTGGFKNALPSEVDDHPDSGMPRQLRTQADNEEPLSRAEADVAGITTTPEMVYGESDEDPNAEDQRDANRADPDEHV